MRQAIGMVVGLGGVVLLVYGPWFWVWLNAKACASAQTVPCPPVRWSGAETIQVVWLPVFAGLLLIWLGWSVFRARR